YPRGDRRARDPRGPRHEPGVRVLHQDGGARLREADRLRRYRGRAAQRPGQAGVSRHRGGRVSEPEATGTAAATADVKTDDVLRLDKLTVERGGRPVVREVSLEVAPGEVTALLGPNGAGKSSLVLAVGGVLRAAGGSVVLGAADLTSRRPERIR